MRQLNMESSTDVDIAGILSATIIGAIAASLSMDQKSPRARFAKITQITGGCILGLATGLIAAWLTEPLDGCSIVKLKDSNLRLVWGTDGVMVRIVVLCGLVGTVLGAAAQGIRAHRITARNGFDTCCPIKPAAVGSPTTSETRPTWIAILEGAFLWLLGGSLLVGLPATFTVTIIRTVRQFS
jgi:hypothetical protein